MENIKRKLLHYTRVYSGVYWDKNIYKKKKLYILLGHIKGYIGIMENLKWKLLHYTRVYSGVYWDNGKENVNY